MDSLWSHIYITQLVTNYNGRGAKRGAWSQDGCAKHLRHHITYKQQSLKSESMSSYVLTGGISKLGLFIQVSWDWPFSKLFFWNSQTLAFPTYPESVALCPHNYARNKEQFLNRALSEETSYNLHHSAIIHSVTTLSLTVPLTVRSVWLFLISITY